MSLKDSTKKIWNFIWYDESVWSWITNIILAFVIVKYLFYPVLGFLLGTQYPIVAVVSGSMDHTNSFNEWWESVCRIEHISEESIKQKDIYGKFNITNKDFMNFKFYNGFNRGDIMILISSNNFKIGDVLVFNSNHKFDPIIHRVITKNENFFKTKGDANCLIADFEEKVPKEKAIGKAFIRIPLLGWVKIIFVELIKLMLPV